MHPFVVKVGPLLNRPGARRQARVSGRIEGLSVVGTTVSDDADVVVDTVLEWVSDGLLATGTASAPWVGECRRCLGAVTGEVGAEFCELFEESPREGESYQLRPDTIDLAPLARETVLLDLPLAPLCRADCRGLCPVCGIDLNQGSCACTESSLDPRWAALDVLRGDAGLSGESRSAG